MLLQATGARGLLSKASCSYPVVGIVLTRREGGASACKGERPRP